MIKREIRQKAILDLVRDNRIKTQDEIVEKLNEQGLRVTQATISRDIKELNISKATGEQYYSWSTKDTGNLAVKKEPGEAVEEDTSALNYKDRVKLIFKEAVVKVDTAYFLVIVHTLPGMAQAAAHAVDTLEWEKIAGTIAGDDTIFVAVKHERDVEEVTRRFRALMK